jgi:hypothetical protein
MVFFNPLLRSSLVDSMRENEINAQPEAFGYFYCTRDVFEPKRGDPLTILSSILKQLSCSRPDGRIQDVVMRKYEDLKTESLQPRSLTLAEVTSLILLLTENGPATIMIDALDECIPDRRYQLLGAIEGLMEKSTGRIKFVVSSRDHHEDIARRLRKNSNFEIDVVSNADDIERFVRLEVDRSIQESRLLSGLVSPELRDTLIHTLINGAQGT